MTTPQGYPPRTARGTNSMAIGALVMMFLLPPLGIVLGVLAGRQIRRTGEDGAGFARAGVIGGIVLTVLYTAVAVALVLVFVRFLDAIEEPDRWLPDQD